MTEEISYGEKAVEITFNPSNDSEVHTLKTKFAEIINTLHKARNRVSTYSPEQAKLCSIAITEAQTAQMWAVKAITWQD